MQGCCHARRDDLESLLYSLLQLLEESLPWSRLTHFPDILQAKQAFFEDCPRSHPLRPLADCIACLGPEQQPDYDLLRSLCQDVAGQLDYQFDWVGTGVRAPVKLIQV